MENKIELIDIETNPSVQTVKIKLNSLDIKIGDKLKSTNGKATMTIQTQVLGYNPVNPEIYIFTVLIESEIEMKEIKLIKNWIVIKS
ncbi:MAG: hypothetical protein WBA16_07635 [Nonlabens sp.]